MAEGSPGTAPGTTLVIDAHPERRGPWLADVWGHREVFLMLARKDFQTRYKRASLGVVWAVAVPVLQGVVMAVVFSRVVPVGGTDDFGARVFAGVLGFSYFATTLGMSVTAIVDGASLTDKVFFPRLLLVLVPGTANLVGLGVSMLVLIGVMPFLGVDYTGHLLLLVPASVLVVAFSMTLSLVVSALHVYYRDVKFLVQAALLVWLYVTPVLYPAALLGSLGPWLDLNPMTGIVLLFQTAVTDTGEGLVRPVAVSIIATLTLAVVGLEAQRRHDRLFVDLL